MSVFTVWKNNKEVKIEFSGSPVADEVLKSAGLLTSHPCGGIGKCGKCRIDISGNISEPDSEEKKFGCRLSCRVRLFGDATAKIPDDIYMQIETQSNADIKPVLPMKGNYGVAVDIGTTTVALKIYSLKDGKLISSLCTLNPQTSVASDVMGRIEKAIKGELETMQTQITSLLYKLISDASENIDFPDVFVITGNTTMLYLLCGISPKSLSCAPFEADTLFGKEIPFFSNTAYLPPCINAFVGADITCAILASGMYEKKETSLFCDIGTNGEIVLFKDGKLYVTSTAAGPAFEGVGISCGCGSVQGAIESVFVKDGEIKTHTIGNTDATGICGSGLIDAVAVGLMLGKIDETGAMDGKFELSGNIGLEPSDIRAVQLAKAAISAGIKTLLEISQTDISEINKFYIGGGFGSHLNIKSAIKTGIFPKELEKCTVILGNASLSGAERILMNKNEIKKLFEISENAVHINLGGNALFNEKYIEEMFF